METDKKILDQLGTALKKTEEMSDEVKRIESATEKKYEKILLKKDAENAELRCRVEKLELEIQRLRAQINNDSNTSSKPPSSDQKPNAPNTYNGRSKTGKRSGGQPSHPGKTLSRWTIEEKIANGEMSHVIVHHGTPSYSYVSKYVIDMQIT
jgi:hypothetical protein